MKADKYHTVRTVKKFNKKNPIEIDTPSKHIFVNSLSWIVRDTSIVMGNAKLVCFTDV